MSNPPGESSAEPSDEEKYLGYGRALRASVDKAIRPWLTQLVLALHGDPLTNALTNAIEVVAEDAWANLTVLIEADVDRPLSGPLEQIRRAAASIGPVLADHGVARPPRDPYDEQMQPDDIYSLGPISFMDLGPDVQSAGITWGAAKAHLHTSRRRPSRP